MNCRIGFLVSVLAAVFATGCRVEKGASTTQSLDNFARAEGESVTRHQCSGDYEVVKGIKAPGDHLDLSSVEPSRRSALRDTLYESLSAVPTSLQTLYFGYGGTIEVTSEAGSICSESLSGSDRKFASEGQAQSSIESCWKTAENSTGFTIYVNDSQSSIRHATVRVFGYVLSQIVTELSLDDQGRVIRKKDKDFERESTRLASRFLGDVSDSDQYSLSRWSEIIDEDLIGASATKRFDTLHGSRFDTFIDFVFAESFDSYYCSDETRSVMASDFGETYEQFAKIAASYEETVERRDGQSTENTYASYGSESSSFQLASAHPGYRLGILGGLFRGGARLLGGIGRGVLRGGGAILRGGGRLLGGVARGAGRVLRGGGRLFGGLIRGAGRLLFGSLTPEALEPQQPNLNRFERTLPHSGEPRRTMTA